MERASDQVATAALASDWAKLGGRKKRGIGFHPRARSQRAAPGRLRLDAYLGLRVHCW